jgi:NAD(P)H dehydrogenase (quinone)
MKTLIVYAHPDYESHNSLILKEVEDALKSKNSDYELIDLYKINYNPVLSKSELTGPPAGRNTDETKIFQTAVTNSDRLIFIYPVWWNTMPAILKGFFDRVFTSGFAFRYKPVLPKSMQGFLSKIFPLAYGFRFDYGMPIGLLKGKKAIVFLTTGSPKGFAHIFNGSRFKKIIQKDTLGFFGIKSKVYQIGDAKVLDDYNRKKIHKAVKKALG